MPRSKRKQGTAQPFAASRKRPAMCDGRYSLPPTAPAVRRLSKAADGKELLPTLLVYVWPTANARDCFFSLLRTMGLIKTTQESTALEQFDALCVDTTRGAYQVFGNAAQMRLLRSKLGTHGIREIEAPMSYAVPGRTKFEYGRKRPSRSKPSNGACALRLATDVQVRPYAIVKEKEVPTHGVNVVQAELDAIHAAYRM